MKQFIVGGFAAVLMAGGLVAAAPPIPILSSPSTHIDDDLSN